MGLLELRSPLHLTQYSFGEDSLLFLVGDGAGIMECLSIVFLWKAVGTGASHGQSSFCDKNFSGYFLPAGFHWHWGFRSEEEFDGWVSVTVFSLRINSSQKLSAILLSPLLSKLSAIYDLEKQKINCINRSFFFLLTIGDVGACSIGCYQE